MNMTFGKVLRSAAILSVVAFDFDFEKRIGDPKLISCEFPVRKEF